MTAGRRSWRHSAARGESYKASLLRCQHFRADRLAPNRECRYSMCWVGGPMGLELPRAAPPAPALVARCVAAATASPYAGVPPRERHLVHSGGERHRDRHHVLRPLVVESAFLHRRRPHRERPRRHHHHLRTPVAVAEHASGSPEFRQPRPLRRRQPEPAPQHPILPGAADRRRDRLSPGHPERGHALLSARQPAIRALLDRLLHRCHIVNIRGNSYRMRRHADLSKAIHPGAARDISPPPETPS